MSSNFNKRKLHKIVYKKLLKEMAIITQTNFVDRIIKIVKEKPKVAGGQFSSFEDVMKSIEGYAIEDVEESLIQEVFKCVDHTGLLSLTGKENKKARKQAEVLMIKQLRRYKNMDGENIDFKGVLPMFDNIADFLEEKADVSFDDCIKAADLYMRNFYNLASEEDKQTISKGKFNFGEIFRKTKFYGSFAKINFDAAGSVLKVYEDDRIKVVWPATPEAFRQTLVNLGFHLDELEHCTRSTSTWYKYHDTQFVTIATPKTGLTKNDREYFFSLKVSLEGELMPGEHCDRYNDHCDEGFEYEYFSEEAIEAIRELPKLAADFTPQEDIEYDKFIKSFAELNDIESLENLFAKMFSIKPDEYVFDKLAELHEGELISSQDLGKIIAESISHHLFANGGLEIDFRSLLSAETYYPVKETLSHFKKKITKNGSHARYFNTLLTLVKNDLDKVLTFEDIKKGLEVAASSNNTLNFQRLINSFLKNNSVSFYLNYKSIANKSAGITRKNLEIYDVIYNSPAMGEYIKQNKINTISHAGSGTKNAKTFLSLLALRFSDDLVNKINDTEENKKISVEDIDSNLLGTYIKSDLGPNGLMARGLGVDREKIFIKTSLEDYISVRNRMFYDIKTLDDVTMNSPVDFRQTVILFLCNSLRTNKNPLDIKKDKTTLSILERLLSYTDYDSEFVVLNLMFKLPYSIVELSVDVKKNLASIVFSSVSIRTNLNVLSDFARSDGRLKEGFFELLAYLDTNKQIPAIKYIARNVYQYGKHQKLIDYLTDAIENSLDNTGFQELVDEITSSSQRTTYGANAFEEDFAFTSALACSPAVNEDIVNKCVIKIVKSYFVYREKRGKPDFGRGFREQIRSEIEKINPKSVCNQELINLFSDETLTDKIATQYLMSPLFFTIVNKFFIGCTLNNVMIPKKLLAAILSSKKSYSHVRPSRDLKTKIFKNFINLSSDGENFLQGKELVLVRDTLIQLLRKNSPNYFSYDGAKKLAISCVMKLNPNARKHMILVFPEIKDQLFEPTEEERAELQADSLIRQYVKMLLS